MSYSNPYTSHSTFRRSEGTPTRREDEYVPYTGSHNQSHHAYNPRTSSSRTYSETPRTTHAPSHEHLHEYNESTYRAGRTAASDATRSSARFPSNDNNHAFGAFRLAGATLEPVLPMSTRPPGIVATSRYQDDNGDPRKRFQCSECSKRFDRQSGLEAHATVHTKERLYACPQIDCNKSFTIKSNMTRHFNNVHARQGSDAGGRHYGYPSTSRESSDRSTPPNTYYSSSRR
ncbi:hypothetical protein BU17DRAFT_93631 [Hysterangium stoloniferum]|nr:hypothetical protein BU17DRAFT_93631 [Hysterangium stoloniferum]